MICEFVNAFANIKARPAGAAALGGTPTLYRPYVKTPRLDAARAVRYLKVRSHSQSHTPPHADTHTCARLSLESRKEEGRASRERPPLTPPSGLSHMQLVGSTGAPRPASPHP